MHSIRSRAGGSARVPTPLTRPPTALQLLQDQAGLARDMVSASSQSLACCSGASSACPASTVHLPRAACPLLQGQVLLARDPHRPHTQHNHPTVPTAIAEPTLVSLPRAGPTSFGLGLGFSRGSRNFTQLGLLLGFSWGRSCFPRGVRGSEAGVFQRSLFQSVGARAFPGGGGRLSSFTQGVMAGVRLPLLGYELFRDGFCFLLVGFWGHLGNVLSPTGLGTWLLLCWVLKSCRSGS